MSVRQTHTVYIQVYTNMDFHPENYDPVSKFEKKVAQAFVENPHGYKYVSHIDGDLTNNAAENLEWVAKTYPYKNKSRK